MSERTFTKEIKVNVTKKDQEEKKNRLVELDREILDVLAEKAGSNKDFNDNLKTLRKEQKAILDVIDTGVETAEVECFERFDEQRMEVLTVRKDTGKVLPEYTRPMTAEERQLNLEPNPAA